MEAEASKSEKLEDAGLENLNDAVTSPRVLAATTSWERKGMGMLEEVWPCQHLILAQ